MRTRCPLNPGDPCRLLDGPNHWRPARVVARRQLDARVMMLDTVRPSELSCRIAELAPADDSPPPPPPPGPTPPAPRGRLRKARGGRRRSGRRDR
jgi:hypothetical protein